MMAVLGNCSPRFLCELPRRDGRRPPLRQSELEAGSSDYPCEPWSKVPVRGLYKENTRMT